MQEPIPSNPLLQTEGLALAQTKLLSDPARIPPKRSPAEWTSSDWLQWANDRIDLFDEQALAEQFD